MPSKIAQRTAPAVTMFRCIGSYAVVGIMLVFSGLMAANLAIAQSPTEGPVEPSNARPATVRILVVSGNNGKPIARREVTISTRGGKQKPQLIATGVTDESGSVSISANFPEWIAVHVKGRFLCEGRRIGTSVQRVADILANGIVEPNNLCNSKVRRSPQPGQLVLFVRRESLKEFLDW